MVKEIRKIYKNNKSGYKGVTHFRNKYRADIRFNGKTIYLGVFDDIIEAAYEYDYYAKQFYGEFASLNFPENKYV